MSRLSRRAILKAAPAAGLATAMPVAALATDKPESAITRLFRQWLALEESFTGANLTDEETDARCDEMREIKFKMLAIPARTTAELAQKITADTM